MIETEPPQLSSDELYSSLCVGDTDGVRSEFPRVLSPLIIDPLVVAYQDFYGYYMPFRTSLSFYGMLLDASASLMVLWKL